MVEAQIAALQDRVNMLFGVGVVSVVKHEMGGWFVVSNGDKTLPLGDNFERADAELLRLSGVTLMTAPKKAEWGERRGRPKKDA